eukprot:TRINITY_DN12507_c0_g1_i2.p1 TRINITY_DN12507_c0_g1~~TRINITY_DN12507_c0_g1_i2.p1  ORF type:complete len:673 (+),score=124.59 TRINITY_DN12507_c0_g1_i2:37-2055(+)
MALDVQDAPASSDTTPTEDAREVQPPSPAWSQAKVLWIAFWVLNLASTLYSTWGGGSRSDDSTKQINASSTADDAMISVRATAPIWVDPADSAAEVRAMFAHAYDGYMRDAFPLDDLRPLSRDGSMSLAEAGNLELEGLERNNYSGVALSLIESLSTLAVMGNVSEFSKGVKWLAARPLLFDQDVRVNVFETMIRLVGALLSAHMLASYSMPELCTWCDSDETEESQQEVDDEADSTEIKSPLLRLAYDLGERLYPAFLESPSFVPYAWVNLRRGVIHNETTKNNLAGAGTGLLEYAVLSRLTGESKFEQAANNCLKELWALQSKLGLYGTHLDIVEPEFEDQHAGIGFGTDSFYEYLLKGYVLLGDRWYWGMFRQAYEGIQRFMRAGSWYADVNAGNGQKVQEVFTSLQAFFPGLQVEIGDLGAANMSHRAFFSVWDRYGLMPERYLYKNQQAHPTMKYYPLRPELAESTLWLYLATRDPYYQQVVGRRIVDGLNEHARVETGGFASVHDVDTMQKENHQQSFFLSETLKYLYLLYNDSFLTDSRYEYVFTTEGHPLPVVPELRENEWTGNPMPQRYRTWCEELGLHVELLGHRCSCLDLEICPVWEDSEPLEEGTARQLSSHIVESVCHVLDKNEAGACLKAEDCGVDAETCRERLCSDEGECFTPETLR